MRIKNKFIWIISVLLLTNWIIPSTISEAQTNLSKSQVEQLKESSFDAETILIKFKQGTPAQTVRSLKSQLKLEQKGVIPHIEVQVVKIPKGRTVKEMIAILEKNPNVEFVDPDFKMQTSLTPNDAFFKDSQKALINLDVEAAWEISTGDYSIPIAVLDTGIYASHEDLRGRIIQGYNFINNNTITNDDNGHGTMVAGILGAASNNGIGIAGVTWKNPIIPVKVMGADGTGTHSAIAQGIIFAVDQGAKVINMSIGGPSSSSTLKYAVDYAHEKGVVIVAAAGNSNSSVMYPAAYPNVIAVGAIDNNDNKASYSNYGPEISVTAPGTAISTLNNGGYATGSGTSFAAPIVSGLAGLILSEASNLSPATVKEVIENGVVDLGVEGFDNYFGWGKVNLHSTLTSLFTSIPIITLKGEPVVDILIGEIYEDAGAEAYDSKEGDISSLMVVTNPVDIEVAGIYTITYNVTNKAGKTAETVTRIVNVHEFLLVPIAPSGGGGIPDFVRDLVPPKAQDAIDRNINRKNEMNSPGNSKQNQQDSPAIETKPTINRAATKQQTIVQQSNKQETNAQKSNIQETINQSVNRQLENLPSVTNTSQIFQKNTPRGLNKN